MSTRTIIVSLLVTIFLASAGVGWLLDLLYSKHRLEKLDSLAILPAQLEAFGKQLAGVLDGVEDKAAIVNAWKKVDGVYVLDLLEKDDLSIPEILEATLDNDGSITLSTADNVKFVHYLKNDDSYLIVQVKNIHADRPTKFLSLALTLTFYFLLILIVSIWFYPLLQRLVILKNSAKTLGKGNLQARIVPGSVSYINDIEFEFNRMAQRIEELVADIKVMSSAISHELRSPLAKLRFGLDALSEEDNPERRIVYEARLSNEVDEMTSLVESTLEFVRFDTNNIKLNFTEIDLIQLCQALVDQYQQTDVFDVQFYVAGESYNITGDEFYLQLLVNNLLSNAIKYGAGKIAISIAHSDQDIYVSVEDNGQGIDNKWGDDIFKPFARGKGVDSQIQGYGLGLALCKRIADWHGAILYSGKSPGLGGAKFTLKFDSGFQVESL